MLKPTQNNLIIRPIEAESKTAFGMIIPDQAQDRPQIGEVVESAVKTIAKGAKVYYKKWGGNEIKHDGEDLIVVEEKDILAILV